MQSVEKITRNIVRQFSAVLKSNPQEFENSVGFVKFNLQPKHVEAALWLEGNRKIAIDAYNLHDLILNFDRCQSIARYVDFVAYADLPPSGRFNPAYLVEYFQTMRGLGKSAIQ